MKKKTPMVEPPPQVAAPTAPIREKPEAPSYTPDLVWGVLAALAGAKASVVAAQSVLKDREKAGYVTIYPPDAAQRELIEKFAAQVAMNERTNIYMALKEQFPEHDNQFADLLVKRGPFSFTMSFKYESTSAPCWSEFALAK